jgi:hypothetical protein
LRSLSEILTSLRSLVSAFTTHYTILTAPKVGY